MLICLFYRKPTFQRNELEQEFQRHRQYSEGMRKLIRKKTVPKHGGKLGQLPPLSSTAPIGDEQQPGGGSSSFVLPIQHRTVVENSSDDDAATKSLVVPSTRDILQKKVEQE